MKLAERQDVEFHFKASWFKEVAADKVSPPVKRDELVIQIERKFVESIAPHNSNLFKMVIEKKHCLDFLYDIVMKNLADAFLTIPSAKKYLWSLWK